MSHHKWFLISALVMILGALQSAHAEPVTITPALLWPDIAGDHINAHCGDIIKVADTYYWVGEFRNARRVQNISCYTSTDLSKWKFDRFVITPATDPEVAHSHFERPKVIYNSKTKKFVMWLHRENTMGYAAAEAAVAQCDTIDGDYAWVDHFRPNGNMSRDSTLFEDDDGSAYFISSSNENADLVMYKLTPDYLKVESQVMKLFPGQYREAPCVFKRNGIYYLINSFCTGTAPNTQFYSTSKNMAGPWTPYRRLAADDTWNTYYSQAAFILTLQGTQTTSYIYCADRWQVTPMRHVWLPLQFHDDGSIAPMHWADSWTLDAKTGQITAPPDLIIKDSTDNIKVTSDYSTKGAMDRDYSHLAGAESAGGNDGDPRTFWCADDNLPGHWWKVDLGQPADITSTEITFHRKNHGYKYQIETSADGNAWKIAADQTRNTNPQASGIDAFPQVSARYVRITITGIPSGYDWPSFNEFKVFAGKTELAQNKPATADSWMPDSDNTKAIDNDPSTAWTLDDRMSDHWLKLDLGKPTDIAGSQILWEAPGFSYWYRIDTSADDKTWKLAVDKTKYTDSLRMPTDHFNATAIRYVRLTLADWDIGCWPGVREFHVLPKR